MDNLETKLTVKVKTYWFSYKPEGVDLLVIILSRAKCVKLYYFNTVICALEFVENCIRCRHVYRKYLSLWKSVVFKLISELSNQRESHPEPK